MRSILLIGITFILAACGRDDLVSLPSTPNPSSISGSYQLTTVDGHDLPFLVLEIGAYQARLLSGTLNLNANGAYSFEFNVRLDDTGNPRMTSVTEVGSWNVTRDSITLVATAGTLPRTGTVSGHVITLGSSNITMVLRK